MSMVTTPRCKKCLSTALLRDFCEATNNRTAYFAEKPRLEITSWGLHAGGKGTLEAGANPMDQLGSWGHSWSKAVGKGNLGWTNPMDPPGNWGQSWRQPGGNKLEKHAGAYKVSTPPEGSE